MIGASTDLDRAVSNAPVNPTMFAMFLLPGHHGKAMFGIILAALLAAGCHGEIRVPPAGGDETGDATREVPTLVSTGSVLRVDLPAQTVAAGTGIIRLRLRTPSGHRLNSLAPSALSLRSSAPDVLTPGESDLRWQSDEPSVEIPIPADFSAGTAELTAIGSIYYCLVEEEGICFLRQLEIRLPVNVRAGAVAGELSIDYELPPAGGP